MRTGRRVLLLAAGASTVAACSQDSQPPTATPTRTTEESSTSVTTSPTPSPTPTGGPPRVLLAYFSRPGENYYYGDRTDLEVGNTKVLAGMIADRIGCDLHEIEAAEAYSDDYDATVRRNVDEQNSNARPKIANAVPDLAAYDVVLLGSPIWNMRPPMIMHTFAEALDFAGKTVHPVVTYAVSGLGTAEEEYRRACPAADLGRGLAVQGEEVAEAGPQVNQWLTQVGLTQA